VLRDESAAAFFEPTRDGMAGQAEGTTQTAQAGALLVGAQDEFALRFRVAVRARVSRRATSAVAAAEALATIGCGPVANDIRALARRTGNGKSDPEKKTKTSLANHRALSHYPIFQCHLLATRDFFDLLAD
jgi:hypothetical protein